MKMIATTALVTALAFAGIGNAEAQRIETRLDRARVVDVDRIVERHQHLHPGRIVQECWNQRTNRYDGGYYRDDRGRLYRNKDDGTAGAVIGALIGGALGNQVGDGRGRTAATVAGAVIGSRVGKDIDERDGHHDDYRNEASRGDGYRNDGYDGQYNRYRTNDGIETRCRTVQTASTNTHARGYEVTFVYAGTEYTTFARQHPGRSIPVEVDVRHGRRGRTVIMDVRPADGFVAQYGYDD